MLQSRSTGICLGRRVPQKRQWQDSLTFLCIRYVRDMEIQFIEGNENCLPTSILKTLDFKKDPGSDQMYTQMYLR